MLYANKKIVKLYSIFYYTRARYYWFKYRCSNIYNNFLADYFPNFWRAESIFIKGILFRYKLHKSIGVHFRPFLKLKRSAHLFDNVNVYLNIYEYYWNKTYYLNRYLKKVTTS